MKLKMFNNEFNGKLITFCGLDGCGKTTQIQKLKEWLEKNEYKTFVTKQPTDAVRESLIFRAYADNQNYADFDYRALSLFCASDRIQHSNRVIAQKLQEGYVVISDRYFYSCLANLIARGYGSDTWIYEISACIPKPDLALFLDVPVDVAIARVKERPAERNRPVDGLFQEKLHDLYINIAQENDGVLISTLLSEETCFENILSEVEKIVR